MRYTKLLMMCAATMLGGCSLLSSTTDTAAHISDAFVDSVAATTDGTTGLSKSGESKLARATAFVKSQIVFLRRDAAAGEGENLDTLASLMGEQDKQAFGRWMQAHYQNLFGVQRSPEGLVNYIATQRS